MEHKKPVDFVVGQNLGGPLEAWQEYWLENLKVEGSIQQFGEGLKERWTTNAVDFAPLGLFAKSNDNTYVDWCVALESFMAQNKVADEIGVALLGEFEKAYVETRPTMSSGIIWFKDVLALRHLNIKTLHDARRLIALLMKALRSVKDCFPGTTAEDYDYFYRFYSVISTCLVSENYEPNLIDEQFNDGLRLTGFDAFSWFNDLETARRRSLDLEDSQYLTPDDVTAPPSVVDQKLLEEYSSLLEALFYSLAKINALSMRKNSDSENLESMFAMLEKFKLTKDAANLYSFMTVQGIIDLPFLRLSSLQVSSPELKNKASLIKLLIEARSSGSSQLKRCAPRYWSIDEMPILKIPCNPAFYQIHRELDALTIMISETSPLGKRLCLEAPELIDNHKNENTLEMA